MESIPKFLISIGILFITLGVIWLLGGKYLHFGKLPGDISVERENFKFYFPLGTSILLSVALSGIMYLIRGCSK